MSSIIVNAKKRDSNKRSNLNELRENGFVPAVVYGYKIETTSIAVNEKDFERTLREDGRTAVMSLDLEGTPVNAVIAEIQKNPVKGDLIHLDFLAVNMNKKIELDVGIIIVGDSIGVREGGSLQMPNREVKLNVEPSKIPDSIEIDITDLAIGDSIAVSDIREQVEFEIIQEDDYVLASVLPPVSAAELESSLDEGSIVADTGEVEEEPKPLKEE